MLHCAQTRVERGEGKEMLEKRGRAGVRERRQIKIYEDKKKQRKQKVMQGGLGKKELQMQTEKMKKKKEEKGHR